MVSPATVDLDPWSEAAVCCAVGSVTVKQLPCQGLEVTAIVPCWAVTSSRAMVSPRPLSRSDFGELPDGLVARQLDQ